jgi:hypothetical protein
MTEPNYNSALAGANARFPGAIPGGAALPPQSIDAQIQALLAGSLGAGDKIARISDITSAIPTASVAAVRSSGVLDEIDFRTIVAVSPFVLLPVSKVWIKGCICYVGLCLQLPAQVTAPVVEGLFQNLCSGLPANPANGSSEANGVLQVTSRYGRGTQTSELGVDLPFKTGVASVNAAGMLQLAGAYPLKGSLATGYIDYLTITGHYPITLLDSVI